MAGTPRDRVVIDLRGIGDAVRSAAAQRHVTVAHMALQALLATVGASEPTATPLGSDCPTPGFSTAKLTLRMPQLHADALIVNAVGLGLSYGEYVARLVNGSPLPRPAAERAADHAALMASSDHLECCRPTSTHLCSCCDAAVQTNLRSTAIASRRWTQTSEATSTWHRSS